MGKPNHTQKMKTLTWDGLEFLSPIETRRQEKHDDQVRALALFVKILVVGAVLIFAARAIDAGVTVLP